jgi:hypothetical protein
MERGEDPIGPARSGEERTGRVQVETAMADQADLVPHPSVAVDAVPGDIGVDVDLPSGQLGGDRRYHLGGFSVLDAEPPSAPAQRLVEGMEGADEESLPPGTDPVEQRRVHYEERADLAC